LASPGSGSLNRMRPPGSIMLARISPLLQRHVAQIVAVQVEQIEGNEVQVMLPTGDRLAQVAEVRQARIVQHDDFAVDDHAFGAERLASVTKSRYFAVQS
jgi:hypothetical protein